MWHTLKFYILKVLEGGELNAGYLFKDYSYELGFRLYVQIKIPLLCDSFYPV